MLSVSIQTMYRLMSGGGLPYMKIRKSRWLRLGDLRAYAARSMQGGGGAQG